ncbi:Hypothetical predicted protein [Octopus vulgaris]|uniref:Uncharacterized protein n=1 Tax=Octopus vulgaris TaxID=6645 RepID=A0AA36B4V3_OCTVU|nr:Hypothetical predicted protein [Octopus vulgaris]
MGILTAEFFATKCDTGENFHCHECCESSLSEVMAHKKSDFICDISQVQSEEEGVEEEQEESSKNAENKSTEQDPLDPRSYFMKKVVHKGVQKEGHYITGEK